MDASEARDQLQLGDRILSRADRTLNMPPLTLIAWGLFGTAVNAVHQARVSGLQTFNDERILIPFMVAGVAASMWGARRQSKERISLADQNAGIVFGAVSITLMLLTGTAQNRAITPQAMALFWCAGFSIALMIVGAKTSRLLLEGGLTMLLACVIAPFVPEWFDGILAIGWALGFFGPGAVMSLQSHGRTVSI